MIDVSVKYCEFFLDVKISGTISPNLKTNLFESILSHEDWSPGTPLLVDESDVFAEEMTETDVQKIAYQCIKHKEKFGDSIIAIIVSRDLEFGLNRMWDVLVEKKWDVIYEFFRSRDEAIEWLGNDSKK